VSGYSHGDAKSAVDCTRSVALTSTSWGVRGVGISARALSLELFNSTVISQGRSDGGYMGIYTPKISPSIHFMR